MQAQALQRVALANARYVRVTLEPRAQSGPRLVTTIKADRDVSPLIPVQHKQFTVQELSGPRIGVPQPGQEIVSKVECTLMKVDVTRVRELRTFVRITFEGDHRPVLQLGNHMTVTFWGQQAVGRSLTGNKRLGRLTDSLLPRVV
jgi:hypothetical protein